MDELHLESQRAYQNGDHPRARELLFKILELDPSNRDAHSNLGKMAKEEGRFSDAIAHCGRLLAHHPDDSRTYANMAGVYGERGDFAEAIALHKKARDIAPRDVRNHDDFLYFLHHVPVPETALFAEHLRYGELFESGRKKSPRAARRPESGERIRIGYVSADLHEHSTFFLLEPILAAHDKNAFAIYLYSTGGTHDRATDALAAHADIFRDAARLSHDELRAQILADEIDILVDMGGHTGGNSLPIFAARSAPIQVSWFGYMDTSGLANMDYRLTDEWRVPRDRARFYTEKLWYLPNSYTFRPQADALPPPSPPPGLGRGSVTFGSFNTSRKIGPDVLDLWAEILRALPSARLSVMTPFGTEYRDRIAREFSARGVDPSRVISREKTDLAGFLRYIADTDIALDPFPYTGGATTYHALSVGVPSVTLEGRTEFARNCAAIMREVNLPDWIAHSPAEYRDLAIAKARDLSSLAALRSTLPSRVGAHTRAVVAAVENAFREMVHPTIGVELR